MGKKKKKAKEKCNDYINETDKLSFVIPLLLQIHSVKS